VKLPEDPQLLPVELAAPKPEVPNETTTDIFLWVSLLAH
jgi:hypothetical protein